MRDRPTTPNREYIRNRLKRYIGKVRISNDFLAGYVAYLSCELRAQREMLLLRHAQILRTALDEENDSRSTQGLPELEKVTPNIGSKALGIRFKDGKNQGDGRG